MKCNKHNRLNYCLPTLGGSWLLVALLVAGSAIFGLLLGIMQGLSSSPFWRYQTLAYILTMLAPFLYIWIASGRARQSSFEEEPAFPINEPRFGKLGTPLTFLLIALALLALSTLVEPLTSILPMPEMVKEMFRKAFVDIRLGDAILSTCILAPLCEELLCRGMMMRGMMRQMSPWKAVLWSAFIFAFIHMNPWQAIPAFIFGVFFGWVYWKTRCLWATIFLHCLNNSFSTVLTRLLPDLDVDEGLIDILPANQYIILYVCCAAVVAFCAVTLYRHFPKDEQETVSA